MLSATCQCNFFRGSLELGVSEINIFNSILFLFSSLTIYGVHLCSHLIWLISHFLIFNQYTFSQQMPKLDRNIVETNSDHNIWMSF